ncbi:site-specific integrase [Microbacterium panaciterrae]|uniref:Site-specific integrase n=1 Tax=Microbacterium panaciterrae TaxID=985759 RepID=A0ABP8P742_9MICO
MGSITPYATDGGKRYRVRFRNPDGRQTDKRGFRTKREAEIFLASIEVAKARGDFVDAAAGRVKLEDLANDWLTSAEARLKPSSYVWLEGAWRVYVQPKWGSARIAEIRHSDVQKWITALADGTAPSTKPINKPLSASSVRRAHSVLHAILNGAVKDRRISFNPAASIALPRKTGKRRLYLTHTQVERLALECGDMGVIVRVLAYTGLRWGELIGLRVRDLDLTKGRLNVTENAVRVNGRIEVGTPKTHRTRSVPLPAFLHPALLRVCEGKSPEHLVFGDGRTYLSQPTHRDAWFTRHLNALRASDPAFPAVTIHDLRHTAASLAISAGANVKVIQRMLGHASAAMTLDTYADLFDDDLDAVSRALDAARTAANVGKMWAERALNAPDDIVTYPQPAETQGESPDPGTWIGASQAPRLGLEPRTCRLTAGCSAN